MFLGVSLLLPPMLPPENHAALTFMDAPKLTVQPATGRCSGVHACQSLRAHMRERELMLRKEADALLNAGALLDAQAKKMIADELDRYCSMINRLESDYSQHTQDAPLCSVCGGLLAIPNRMGMSLAPGVMWCAKCQRVMNINEGTNRNINTK